ncbi:hypothetical protein BJ912DRAFT_997550 [Pholiota molesta]|nr:hypothetical protein BJ912DRAFT_997550 [Pholiota molesta]
MLIILLFFALIRTLRGFPLASSVEGSDTYLTLDPRDSQTHFGQRRVNDIVISCAVTIFACTWSAIHPNIPAVTDSPWKRLKRQITTTIYAFLVPELVTIWAVRQRLGAASIRDNYNAAIYGWEPGPKQSVLQAIRGWFKDILNTVRGLFQDSEPDTQWSLTHGFFLQMGGFMLRGEDGVVPPLILRGDHENRYRVGEKTTSMIWNIRSGVIDPPQITTEAIKDRSKGNAISKAFIVLQTIWFIVQCVARWSAHLPVTELEVITLGFAMLNGITYALWWDKPQNVQQPVFLERKIDSIQFDYKNDRNIIAVRRPVSSLSMEHRFLPSLRDVSLLAPLERMYADSDEHWGDMRVGTYYAAFHTHQSNIVELVATVIGISFGAVHLIPTWFLEFSSSQEMWLWRASAIFLTLEPIFIGLWTFPALSSLMYRLTSFLEEFFLIITVIGIPLYFISRSVLFTLSITSLRSLHPAALQTIAWTTFIPHL